MKLGFLSLFLHNCFVGGNTTKSQTRRYILKERRKVLIEAIDL